MWRGRRGCRGRAGAAAAALWVWVQGWCWRVGAVSLICWMRIGAQGSSSSPGELKGWGTPSYFLQCSSQKHASRAVIASGRWHSVRRTCAWEQLRGREHTVQGLQHSMRQHAHASSRQDWAESWVPSWIPSWIPSAVQRHTGACSRLLYACCTRAELTIIAQKLRQFPPTASQSPPLAPEGTALL